MEKYGGRDDSSFLERFLYSYCSKIYDREYTDKPFTKENIPDLAYEDSVKLNADKIEANI